MAKYVGKRIVPKHCGYWDAANEYEMESIVYHKASGNSYISRKTVPAGTDISQTYYWALCSDFNMQMDLLEKHFTATEQRIKEDNDETEASIKADNDATETAIKKDNANTASIIKSDNASTAAAIKADNASTAAEIQSDNEATVQTVISNNASTRTTVEKRVSNAETAMKEAKTGFDDTVSLLNKRMDSVLAAGTGAGDTEILDARVDADGVTHDSLGTAIREPMSKLKTDMSQQIYPMVGIAWHKGYVIDEKGRVKELADYAHTDLISCMAGKTIRFAAATAHTGVSGIAFYDINNTFISGVFGDVANYTEKEVIVPENAKFCRLSAHADKTQSAYILPEDGVLPEWVSNLIDDKVNARLSRVETINGYHWNPGYVNIKGDLVLGVSNRFYTDLLPCVPGVEIRFVGESDNEKVTVIAYYDADGKYLSGVRGVGTRGEEQMATVPEGVSFVRLSTDDDTFDKSYIEFSEGTISKSLINLNGRMDNAIATVPSICDTVMTELIPSSMRGLTLVNLFDCAIHTNSAGVEAIDGGYTVTAGGYYFPYIDIIKYATGEKPLTLTIWCDGLEKDSQLTLCVSSVKDSRKGEYYSLERNGNWFTKQIDYALFDETYRYLIIACDNRNMEGTITIKDISLSEGVYTDLKGIPEPTVIPPSTVYISTTGSDENEGTASAPYATVNKALQNGASHILMYAGTYKQKINLALSNEQTISIGCVNETGRVIFEGEQSLITESEMAVEGYEKIYSASVDKVFPAAMVWIFQDGVNEVSTLISDEERHPLERGKEYRCEDTRIVKCSAATLADALTEIEKAADYRWFYDAANTTLYFSRPQEITAANPLKSHFGSETLFLNAKRMKTLLLTGIETKYLCFNVVFTIGSRIVDCRAANVVAGGAFIYNRCVGAEFIRCEALHTNSGSNGDGFNGHSETAGDPFSKQTTVSLIDCWAHDNQDDGYSDHERSEITIIGGLFEWNGKGGVVPSYGSHCTCYNATSRHNYNGFYYTGMATEAEAGKYGQGVFIGCIAENNNRGSKKSGFFVDGDGNRMYCIDCRSAGNEYGYMVAENAYMKLVDCRAKDNTKGIKNEVGNQITVANTELVE